MNCRDFESELGPLADEALTPQRAAEVRAHVAGCPACAAVVAEWRNLRQTVRRAIQSVDVPPALQRRIVGALPSRRKPRRVVAIGAIGLATAAAAAWFVWLRPLQAVTIDPQGFARIHAKCAVGETAHDTLGAAVRSRTDVLAHARDSAGFRAVLPDLGPRGYRLAGVCFCSPDASQPARILHATYQSADSTAGPISLFSTNREIILPGVAPVSAKCHAKRALRAATCGETQIVVWVENGFTCMVCGTQPVDLLAQLSDDVDVAQLQSQWNTAPLATGKWP